MPRHTHPGVESVHCLEGTAQLAVRASPTAWSNQATIIRCRPTPHGAKIGDQPFKLVVTCTVERDKPLATSVAE